MKNNKKFLWLLGAGIVLLLLLIIGSILWFGNGKRDEKIVIGVVLPGSADEEGWNGIHYQGIKTACEEFGVDIRLYENVEEYSGECEKVICEMAEEGIRVIFLESYNYLTEAEKTMEKYPEIMFYCCSVESSLTNYVAYFTRVYQARYLSGIVAGMMTQSNHIGYVAAMDNNEVNRGINAFTIGVRSVNPSAVVHVVYTEAWDNEEAERSGADALVENCQADVLTYHQNQPFVVDEAQKLGVHVIGYNIEQGDYSGYLVASVGSDWSMVYREIINDYLQKKESGTGNYWIGIEKDAVGLTFYSDDVSRDIIKAVDDAVIQLCDSREVFSGAIYDNEGNIRCTEDEVIRDEILLKYMDWLVEGVELYEMD